MLRTTVVAACLAAGLGAVGCSDVRARDRFLASGDRHRAGGRLTEAVIEYRNAVQRDPSSAKAHRKLAEAYLASNEPAKALDVYETLSDLDRASVPARLRSSSLLSAAGEFERAVSRAREAVALEPKNVEAHVLLAQALAGLRRTGDAMQQLFDAIAANPDEAVPYAAIGELYLSRGANAHAEASFLKAVEIDPSSVPARLSLGEYYRVAGRTADADVQLRAAHDLAPLDPLVNRAFALFLMAADRGPSAEPHWKVIAAASEDDSGELELCDYYVWSGRLRDALRVVEPLAAGDRTGRAVTRVAAIWYGLGDRASAEALLQDELRIRKSNAGAHLVMGRIRMAQQRWQEAAMHGRRATVLKRDSWVAFDLLGSALAAAGQLREAAEAFREASRLHPGANGPRLKLAAAYASAGDANGALHTLEEAFGTERESAIAAANNLALALSGDERTRSTALQLASYAAARLPGRAEPGDTLGSIHLLRGDTAAAVDAFEKSVRLAPEKAAYRERLLKARRQSAALRQRAAGR